MEGARARLPRAGETSWRRVDPFYLCNLMIGIFGFFSFSLSLSFSFSLFCFMMLQRSERNVKERNKAFGEC